MNNPKMFPLAWCLLLVGTSFASPTTSTTVQSTITMDTVDISLDQTACYDESLIFDDEVLTSVNTLTNKGARCWIRAANRLAWVDAQGGNSRQTATENLTGPDAWYLAPDGWLYLTRVMEEEEILQLNQAISNPEHPEWDGRGFLINSTVELQAVQARNFEPDFQKPQPWGDIQPDACINTRSEK